MQQESLEIKIGEVFRFVTGLRIDKLQLVPGPLHQLRTRLRADANPVDLPWHSHGSVCFDGDFESGLMKRPDQYAIHLQHGLATRENDEGRAARKIPPYLQTGAGHVLRRLELAASGSVRTNEIRIAKLTDGLSAVLFAATPEVAPRESAENRAPARLCAFALERQVDFLD